jgi:hypothetical protein
MCPRWAAVPYKTSRRPGRLNKVARRKEERLHKFRLGSGGLVQASSYYLTTPIDHEERAYS